MSNIDTESNPEIGMQEDSFDDIAETSSGSDGFFDALENQVNSGIQDPSEETHRDFGPNMAQPEVTQEMSQDGPNNTVQSEGGTDWKKRYTDSSREAVKLKDQMNELTPFVPVLEAMKNDSGLVSHVRDYLVNGGQSKSIQEKLNLDENFIFDANEAMQDTDSDSAKLMNAHVDRLVQLRVGDVLQKEKANAGAVRAEYQKRKQEHDFRQKHNMSEEEYGKFVDQAKSHVLTLEDVHHLVNRDTVAANKAKSHVLSLDDVNYLINRDKTATNTANATRTDMLNQMKNARNMPTSASGANSQPVPQSQENDVFNALVGMDDDMDNLFG